MSGPIMFFTEEEPSMVLPKSTILSKDRLRNGQRSRQKTPPSPYSFHLTGAKEDDEMTVDDQHDLEDDIDLRSISFKLPGDGIIDEAESIEEKCTWLRAQLVGNDVEFEAPFGKRLLTYADHTASGRCLHHIENYIVENFLPFYGNTHTDDSFVGHQMTKCWRS